MSETQLMAKPIDTPDGAPESHSASIELAARMARTEPATHDVGAAAKDTTITVQPPEPFALEQHPLQLSTPKASQWWRRVLRLGPSAEDVAAQDRSMVLQTNFGRPLTIMVASPKGGSGKTPTARCLGAAFASARGGGVVVLDNNELRGSLASRSLVAHPGNLGDVLRSSSWFLSRDATVLALEQTMHRQPYSHEWVLGSDPHAPAPLTAMQFGTVHDVLRHFFSIIVVDTGNNELAQNWLACAHAADLLVVPMKWRRDHMGPAAQMLDDFALNRPELLERTVIVGTNGPGDADSAGRAEGLRLFGRLPIVEIPTDGALTNTLISWPQLHPATRRAYETLAVHLCDLAPTPERN